MITINEFLDSVLIDFKEYVNSQDRLCSLLDVHFDAGNVPDYSDKHIQQLYLLRYAYAYAFDYKRLYGTLLAHVPFIDSIKVTSIGCGNLIDYWSLAHVVDENCRITYRGIDTINWSYRIQGREKDDVIASIGNVIDLFSKSGTFSSDIYVFPKSISEFSMNDIDQLIGNFTKDSVTKDKVHFLFTLRTDKESKARDMAKTFTIYQHMLDCGFHSDDNPNRIYSFSESNKGKKIQTVDSDFNHPGSAVDFLANLYNHCTKRASCNRNSNCAQRLGRWPILNCQYTIGQIFTFER